MERKYVSVPIYREDWEKLKYLTIKKRTSIVQLIHDFINFYESHHKGENGRKRKGPKDGGG